MSHRRNHPRIGINGILQGLFTLNRTIEILRTYSRRKVVNSIAQNNKQLVLDNTVSGRQENTRLGTLKDAEELGFLEEYCGPLMGFIDNHPASLPWDYHISTCSFSGGGKSTTLSITNCIYLAMGKTPESIVVLDIKGELSWQTAEGRSKLDGIDAVFINPWNMNGLPNCRINFFYGIIEKAQGGKKIVDACIQKVRQRFGDPNKYGVNSWIYKDAMRICIVLLIYRATNKPDECSPADFWDFGCITHEEFTAELVLMAESSAGEGYVKRQAIKLLDQYAREHSDQFEWVMEAFTDNFSNYAMGSVLRDSVKVTDVDVALLKKRPQAIYILIPDTYIDSHGDYVSDLIEYLTTAIANADGNVRTTFMLDEFVNIPKIQSMIKALRLYRSKLIRIWTFTQDRSGFNKYKDEGGYMPFEESSVTLAWGISGKHAQELSDKAGKRTELIATPNNSAGISSDTGGHSTSEIQVPNLPVSKISQDFQGTAILDAKSKIFVIDRKPWWEIEWIKDYIRDPNKYPMPHFED